MYELFNLEYAYNGKNLLEIAKNITENEPPEINDKDLNKIYIR